MIAELTRWIRCAIYVVPVTRWTDCRLLSDYWAAYVGSSRTPVDCWLLLSPGYSCPVVTLPHLAICWTLIAVTFGASVVDYVALFTVRFGGRLRWRCPRYAENVTL